MIAILILQWNRADDTIECIRSVQRIPTSNHTIFLIDNGSHPDELHKVRAAFPSLTYIENKENLGFAGGYNQGIKAALAAGAAYCLLLNNDTTVDPHILTAFLTAAHTYPHAGAFGAKIYFFDEPTTLWYAGGEVDPKTQRCYHKGCGTSDLLKAHEQIEPTGYACGCALFVPRHAIEKVGFLDERFFLLWEEIDWCYRMRQAGYESLFVPDAKVWHKVSQSFEGGNRAPQWQYFYFRSRLLFIQKHLTRYKRYRFYIKTLIPELCEIIGALLHRHTSTRHRDQHKAALRGICAGLTIRRR